MKILLVKLNHLGDTLLLTPTLRALREKFPRAEIDVMVRGGGEAMLAGNPDLNRIIPLASPERSGRSTAKNFAEFQRAFRQVFARRHDYAFDLSGSDRAKFWVALSLARQRGINDAYRQLGPSRLLFNRISRFDWARQHQVLKDYRTVGDAVGLDASPGPLRFFPRVDERRFAEKFPALAGLKNFAVIHPTSRWAFKQWLPEQWGAVADELSQRFGLEVVISSGPAPREQEESRRIQAAARRPLHLTAGQTSIDELGWLLGRAKIFLGVDTVAMHLAAAMQAPTVALFGPSSEWSWHPWQARHALVLGLCPCKLTRKFSCDKSRPYPCMEQITPDQVVEAAGRMLSHA